MALSVETFGFRGDQHRPGPPGGLQPQPLDQQDDRRRAERQLRGRDDGVDRIIHQRSQFRRGGNENSTLFRTGPRVFLGAVYLFQMITR